MSVPSLFPTQDRRRAADPARTLKVVHQLAHPGHMPAADNQRFLVHALEEQLEMPKRRALQTFNALTSNQRIAVNAHKAITKLVFQGFQRLIQQHFTARMTQGYVFMVGNKVDHLIQRNQLDAFAGACTDVAARAATAVHGRTGQGGELHTVGPLSFLQRLTEAFGAHWFDEIANRADLEGFQSKFIMGGTENHGWRRLALT